MQIASFIDHTLLKATASEAEITKLCNEAITHQFYAVCVNGFYVPLAKRLLTNTSVKIAAVVGFPLGQMSTKAKIFEAQEAVLQGADEIDMVINIAALKDKAYTIVQEEIAGIKKAIGKEKILKVIFENCYLSQEEILKACELSLGAEADFVKTSTGFGTAGASVEQVQWMLEAVKGKAKVKAAGGIRSLEDAQKYIQMGVMRLGTSAGVSLVQGETIQQGY